MCYRFRDNNPPDFLEGVVLSWDELPESTFTGCSIWWTSKSINWTNKGTMYYMDD